MWSVLPETQKRVITLCYDPCNANPTAGTVAVTTGGVSLRLCTVTGSKVTKKTIFLQIMYCGVRLG